MCCASQPGSLGLCRRLSAKLFFDVVEGLSQPERCHARTRAPQRHALQRSGSRRHALHNQLQVNGAGKLLWFWVSQSVVTSAGSENCVGHNGREDGSGGGGGNRQRNPAAASLQH